MIKWSAFATFVAFALLPATAHAGPPLEIVHRALIGTWQNIGDTRFTREFAADGTVVDRYADDPRSAAKGIWILFNGIVPLAEAASLQTLSNLPQSRGRQSVS